MNKTQVRNELVIKYGYTPDNAKYVVDYTAWDTDHPNKEWKTPNSDGFITLRYHGPSRFTLEDHREFPGKPLAIVGLARYNRGSSKGNRPRREPDMPPARGRRAAAAPAPAPAPEPEENEAVDYQRYLDKDPTPTMQDYITWFEDNVAALEDVPADKLLVLGASLYGHFQRSDFNQERREERRAGRAARSAPEPEPEPEPEPAKPAGRGRPRRAAAAAAPAPAPAPAPARRGRGRPKAAAAEAPY